MVATSTSPDSTPCAVGLPDAPASPSNRCRYKTGKCTNVRSNKRNGQPHQLCLYHRDKANKIQRKFDRQKRQVARTKKTRSSTPNSTLSVLASPSSISMLDMAALAGLTPTAEVVSPAGSTYSTSSSTSSMASNGSPMYTPDSVDCHLNESAWSRLPVAGHSLLGGFHHHLIMPSRCYQSYLSSDEIDFLCSAILE